MGELNARIAVRKAKYFLAQAKAIQSDDAALNDRLPFAANLEASIIYARSSLDHLRKEMKPVHNRAGYKRWHENKFAALKKANLVFGNFTGRRDFIIHEGPETTNAQIPIAARFSGSSSVSLAMGVIRADGKVEKVESPAPPNSSPAKPATAESFPPQVGQTTFFFADSNLRAKPAVEYVREFIDLCENFVAEAENKFT